MPRTSNKAAAKKVSVELIPRESPVGFRMYQLLDELIEQHHQDKIAARIALVWNFSWTPDIDGNIRPVRTSITTDLQRELLQDDRVDVVIQILHAWWMDERVSAINRRAELDNGICAFEPVLDKNGDHEEDARERKRWRLRGFDFQAYAETVERYGPDIAAGGPELAAAIKRSPANFTGCEICRADETTPNGFISTDKNTVKQCSCVTAFKAIQQELTAVS